MSYNRVKYIMEALPYIKEFHGKTFVIKYGGAAMVTPALKESVARDLVLLKLVGIHPVVVHGGGPQISQMMEKLGKKPVFKNGQRVTDDETMEIVEMVLAKVGQDIVNNINKAGGRGVAITGKDGGLIKASPLSVEMGLVGKIEQVDASIIKILDESGFIPVVAPIGSDLKGKTYNLNADIVAAGIASALGAEKLIYMTDVRGIYSDNRFISSLRLSEAEELLSTGKITEGMIPKISSAIEALAKGVKKVHIIDGKIEHALLLEIFTDEGIGTQIEP